MPEQSMSHAERAAREELAAFYRIVHHFGWDEVIFSHISLRLPGPERHFLINPFGLRYDEITASNLAKIDLAGNLVEPGEQPINKAGFVIHSAVHEARDDAHCVVHIHTTAGMAVAAQACGLRSIGFYAAALHDKLSYHPFEGSVVTDGEKVRLVQNLGSNNALILRNHGLLACGATVASAFTTIFTLQRACEVQIAALAGGTELIDVSLEVRDAHRHALDRTIKDSIANDTSQLERLAFDAMVRKMESIDPSFRL